MPSYEIELKSLLGDHARAAQFQAALQADGAVLDATSQQLNHYFVGDHLQALHTAAAAYLTADDSAQLATIAAHAVQSSVRTRQLNDTVLLIVKASIDATTSANGIARLEFEAPTLGLTLDALDALVQSAGFGVQAKWSRHREQYTLDGITVCLDRNAGYGYLAEFELMVQDAADADTAKQRLSALMARLGVDELPQARLERMFAHYNAHWAAYYGTDRTFTVD
ncbi:MAG: CYTH domain-containing protein [Armatimonadetes bacterium]|nr:CYTH domain-containing protein [Anaerolineae bacterium]